MEYSFYEMVLLIVLTVVIVVSCYRLTSQYDFWSSRGVPGPKPSFLFGNFKHVTLAKISLGDFLTEGYKTYENEAMWGVYSFQTPILVVKDPEFIKDVLIKDFTVFSHRGFKVSEKVEPLSQHLFNLETERWRPLRSKLSPIFTSGKLKNMFPLLIECADHLKSFLKLQVDKHSAIECRELTAKFTTDVISVCVFGFKTNSLSEKDSEFRKFGRQFFDTSGLKILRLKMREIMPRFYHLLKPLMYDKEFNDFFISTVTQTISYREKNNFRRNDFIDLLMDIKNDPSKVHDIGK